MTFSLANKSALALGLLLAAGWIVSGPALGKASRAPATTEADPLTLTGSTLRIEDLVLVAREGLPVSIDTEALLRVERSHELVLVAAREGHVIYGLNRGVGLNKDRSAISGDRLDSATRRASEEFNVGLLRSHQVSIGPELNEETVRAVLLARLNSMLTGASGARPEVVQMYAEFLNRRIHPVMTSRGTVGEADITILPSIGLAFLGEGDVHYKGERIPAQRALEQEGLVPVTPFAKDALAILSSNAYAAGASALALERAQTTLDSFQFVFALSLEGLNGNVAPLVPEVQRLRPFPFQNEAAREVRSLLRGSYLWEPDPDRPLQDPLSFRDATQVHAAARQALDTAWAALEIQLNSSDDNPAVIVDAAPDSRETHIPGCYYVESEMVRGMVIPTANFEPISWVRPVEAVGTTLGHVSALSTQRVQRLGSPYFTSLSRFLASQEGSHGFGALEKTCVALNAEIRQLAMPASLDSLSTAGGIEDAGTNSGLVVARLQEILDILEELAGIELTLAAQAVELRGRSVESRELALGEDTAMLYAAFREIIPLYDGNRPLSPDLQQARDFVRELPAARSTW